LSWLLGLGVIATEVAGVDRPEADADVDHVNEHDHHAHRTAKGDQERGGHESQARAHHRPGDVLDATLTNARHEPVAVVADEAEDFAGAKGDHGKEDERDEGVRDKHDLCPQFADVRGDNVWQAGRIAGL
jgi:hypothetical protein